MEIITCLKLLSPTYKIEQKTVEGAEVPTVAEPAVTNTEGTEEAQAQPQTIPTLVFGKVAGEGYEGEIIYQYRLEILDEEGYVIEEEQGETDQYELTKKGTYNFYVNARTVDEEVNVQESDTVLIKINGNEIVQDEKSKDTSLTEAVKVEVKNSSR